MTFLIYFDFSSCYLSVADFKRTAESIRGIQTLKLDFLRVILTHNFVFKGLFPGFSVWNTQKMCVINSRGTIIYKITSFTVPRTSN